MAYVKKQFAKLDAIPGLYIKDIFCDKDGEFFSTLRHTTIKQQKTYHLIIGKIRKICIGLTKGNPEELFWFSLFYCIGNYKDWARHTYIRKRDKEIERDREMLFLI